MLSRFSFLLFFAFCSLNAQQTYVPDDGFEQHLIYYGYDDVLDNYVLTSNINTIEYLELNRNIEDIEDLTGLENFINLKNLIIFAISAPEVDLSNNLLLEDFNIHSQYTNQIDFSQNQNLKKASISYVQLDLIDLSNKPLLEEVFIYYYNGQVNLSQTPNLRKVELDLNFFLSEIDFTDSPLLEDVHISVAPLTEIDFSQNPNLKKLYILINPLEEIDVSNNILLEDFSLLNTHMPQLDLSQNINLKSLTLEYSSITEIDLSNNLLLESLILRNQYLSDLNLSNNVNLKQLSVLDGNFYTIDTSNLPLLEYLNLDNFIIDFIDLSNNTNLENVRIYNLYGLDYFNLQNGNNTNITNFYSISNDVLNCIQVDDPVWSEENWNSIDDHTSFESFCEIILDTNDIKSAEKIKFYPNPVENILTIENTDLKIDKINLIDVSGKTVLTKSLNTNPIKLNLKSYPKGIYFLQLVSGEKIIQTEKIIKK